MNGAAVRASASANAEFNASGINALPANHSVAVSQICPPVCLDPYNSITC
jgi:hypothetical protein